MKLRPAVSVLILPAFACGGMADQGAESLVRRYNERIASAYRTGDPRLVEGVAGPEEAAKLTGLIGVKLDRGVVLDSELLDLKVTRVARPSRERVIVETRERWRYTDREITTGRPVGSEVTDRYAVRYVLESREDTWVVNRVEFIEPPTTDGGGHSVGLPANALPGSGGGAAPDRQTTDQGDGA